MRRKKGKERTDEVKRIVKQFRKLLEDVVEQRIPGENLDELRKRYAVLFDRLYFLDSREHALILAEISVVSGEPLKVIMEENVTRETVQSVKGVWNELLKELSVVDRLTPREQRMAALAHGVLGLLALQQEHNFPLFLDHVHQLYALTQNIRFRFPQEGILLMAMIEKMVDILAYVGEEDLVELLAWRAVEILNTLGTRFPEVEWWVWTLKMTWYTVRGFRRHPDHATTAVLEHLHQSIKDWLELEGKQQDEDLWRPSVYWGMMVMTEIARYYADVGDEKVLDVANRAREWLGGPVGKPLKEVERTLFSARLDAASGQFFAGRGEKEEAFRFLQQAGHAYCRIFPSEVHRTIPGGSAEAGEVFRHLALLLRETHPERALTCARICANAVAVDIEDSKARDLFAWASVFRGTFLKEKGKTRKALKETEKALQKILPEVIEVKAWTDAERELVELYQDLIREEKEKIPHDLQGLLESFQRLQRSSREG